MSTQSITEAELAVREIEAFQRDVAQMRVTPSLSYDEIRARMDAYDFAEALPFSAVLGDVAYLLRHGTVHATHPCYFGLFVPSVATAAVWGDALAAAYNPQLAARWHAPAANVIEHHTSRFLAATIGFPARTSHFTTGASEAHLTALLAAIQSGFPGAHEHGVANIAGQATVYVSTQAHHSLHKVIRVAGLGHRALRLVPCNARHQMDTAVLAEFLAHDAANDRRAVMVMATIGTTTAGAVDDLAAVGALARRHGAWFHVDAAWGGAAAFAPSLRHLFNGIELADSVAWDAHKSLPVPMGAGLFFCRHARAVQSVFAVKPDYLPGGGDEDAEPYASTLQWSRRFIGLKVFLALATAGEAALAHRIERQANIADYLRRSLWCCDWRVVNDTPLPVVCFTHSRLPLARLNEIARVVTARGRAWISHAQLPEGAVLRACITNDDTTERHVDVLCNELAAAVAELETRHSART